MSYKTLLFKLPNNEIGDSFLTKPDNYNIFSNLFYVRHFTQKYMLLYYNTR